MKLEKHKITEDLEVDVIGYITPRGDILAEEVPGTIPLVDLPMMSDEKWLQMCRKDREKRPEIYAEIDRMIRDGEFPPISDIPLVNLHRK